MTPDERMARQLARHIVEPEQNIQPVVDVLLKMARWKERQMNKRLLAQLRRLSATQKALDKVNAQPMA